MLAIGHFALGAIFGLLILLFLRFKGKLKYDILIIPLSGLWAMLPDIGAIWGDMATDHHPVMNVFWFHQLIDENLTDAPETAAVFILVAVALLGVYMWRMKVVKI